MLFAVPPPLIVSRGGVGEVNALLLPFVVILLFSYFVGYISRPFYFLKYRSVFCTIYFHVLFLLIFSSLVIELHITAAS